MKKLLLIAFLLIALPMTLGCSGLFEPTTGSLAVKLIWPEASSLKKTTSVSTNPVTVEITIDPGNKVARFDYNAGFGVIGELDPGVYSVYAEALDETDVAILWGSIDGVRVKAGGQAEVSITLE